LIAAAVAAVHVRRLLLLLSSVGVLKFPPILAIKSVGIKLKTPEIYFA
jgi:hypothetical protein